MAIQTLFGNPEPPAEEEKSGSLFGRMREALKKTRTSLEQRVEDIVAITRPIDEAALEDLEVSLISADLGVPTVTRILEDLRGRVRRSELRDGKALKEALRDEIETLLNEVATRPAYVMHPPAVFFLVGVNGTGKTTTAGKLSARLQREGKHVMLCAADTFRAAAIEQLEVWKERSGVALVKSRPGADPSSVLFDAMQSAKAQSLDTVIVDTAGRLHNKAGLMAELDKMRRTAHRFSPGAPHETYLVMDATTGQNGLQQARMFTETCGVTGIVLTKLDGTAKGGVVVAIAQQLQLPVKYVGVGEKLDDLLPFDSKAFAASLLG